MNKPPTTQDAVQLVLTHITRQAGRSNQAAGDDGLLAFPTLPTEALAALGPLTRLDPSARPDSLPSLLLETDSGPLQIEICPFGPLALLSSDGLTDTDPAAQLLWDAEIFPLFPADLDEAGPWHGAPLADWLFPPRLSRALELFESLR